MEKDEIITDKLNVSVWKNFYKYLKPYKKELLIVSTLLVITVGTIAAAPLVEGFVTTQLLSDVTGVKQKIIGEINALLPEGVEFIACHPMAGRELRGIHYADSSRFENANFIIVPCENNSQDAIDTAHQLAEILGFRKISHLSGQEHDQMIGFLSQLTHVIAVSLMNASDNTHLKEYTGDSFRDLTRIAKINEDMWPELFILNKENLIHEIRVFTDEMNAFAKLIEEEDVDTMKQKMIISTQRRKQFDPKGDEK